jgi:hypothetical protein
MLTADGEIFRIDFGFVFGDGPRVDSAVVWLPKTVEDALGPGFDKMGQAAVQAVKEVLEAWRNEPDHVRVFTVAFRLNASAYHKQLDCKAFESKLSSLSGIQMGKGFKALLHRVGYANGSKTREDETINVLTPLALIALRHPDQTLVNSLVKQLFAEIDRPRQMPQLCIAAARGLALFGYRICCGEPELCSDLTRDYDDHWKFQEAIFRDILLYVMTQADDKKQTEEDWARSWAYTPSHRAWITHEIHATKGHVPVTRI